MTTLSYKTRIPVASALVLASGWASAQVLEEVVVTAQKREQNVQDVGIAISAFTGEQMDALGFTNAQQVTALAPGVSTVQPNGEANYSIAIRGAASSDFTSNNESPVALYVDEVYISQMSGAGFMLFDMERVELLRGPQGTLYGRNATGGLAHFVTKRPGQEFDAYAQLTGGYYEQVKFEGAVGGGLTDTLSARLSVATHHNEGYVENRFRDEKLNNANDYALRGQLLFEPNEDVSFLLNGRFALSQIRTGFFEYASAVTTNFRTPGVPNTVLGSGYVDLDGDVYAGDYDRRGHNDLESWGVTGTLNWAIGEWDLVSITDFSRVKRDYIEDSDASPFELFDFYLSTDSEQFSQELRLSGEFENLKWVTGFYYLDIDIADANGGESNLFADIFSNAVFGVPFGPADNNQFGFGLDRGLDTPYTIETQSWSVFGQLEYAFNPQWTGIVGFRWIEEDKDYTYNTNVVRFLPGSQRRNGNPNVVVNMLNFETSTSDSLWTARVELDWRPTDDLLWYASWNRGSKASGFNAPFIVPACAFNVPQDCENLLPYDPEKLDAFEVGFKWTLFDGRARLNGAGYYYDYTDYQAFNLIGLDAVTTNRSAENHGFELELQATPLEGLDFMFGIGYIHAEIDLDGRKTRPVQTPRWNYNGLLRYQWPSFMGGTMAIQGDFVYRAAHLFALTGLNTVNQGSYILGNATLAYTTEDEKWELSVFVQNIADAEYRVQHFDLSGDITSPAGGVLGLVEEYYGKPRWVGGSVRYRF